MRLHNWFIRNLDDIQREVIIESIDKNIIVQGVAGSGKTNLAIHRALQAKGRGTYAIVILTIALKRMIAYGMKELGLDDERIAYDWAWQNRGFDLKGDVYCIGHYDSEKLVIENSSFVYLVNDNKVRKFKLNFRDHSPSKDKIQNYFGIDFADWAPRVLYDTWGRRFSWFEEVTMDNDFTLTNPLYCLVASGTLYRPCESIIDYLVVDEVQDFKDLYIKNAFVPQTGKSLSLFGDSNQMMNSFGSSVAEIRNTFPGFKFHDLKYNYRLPKSVARVAQKIAKPELDLITDNLKNAGDSDFPTFPKPIIKKCKSREVEIAWIAKKIENEALDDVAILVKNDSDVQEVINLLSANGITDVQTHYRTRREVPFHTINTLDFSNNDLPCILDYYAAKGSEFEHVFVPFSNEGQVGRRQDFFVACTRASNSLYITYSGEKTTYLNDVNKQDIVEL